MSVDLHIHTTASDGTDTPTQVVQRAYSLGINILAVTDHDTVTGIAEARDALLPGMTLIPGIELSSAVHGKGGFRCHILGYGIDPESPYIKEAVEWGIKKRRLKLDMRIEFLRTEYGIELSEAELAWLYSLNAPARLHIAELLVARGLVSNNDEAIEKYLNYGRMPDERIDAEMAISAVLKSGGVPIFAHPLGGEGDVHLRMDELSRRAVRLSEMGVLGLECFYSRYTRAESESLCREAKARGLLISAGSDYHGGNKTVKLGSVSSEGYEPGMEEITVLERLL